MIKFLECAACLIVKRGIKTRTSVDHTCGRFGKGHKEPIRRDLGDGTYYKVLVHRKIAYSIENNSELYSVVRGQWVNGYKVPPGVETWFCRRDVIGRDDEKPNGPGVEKFLWVHERFYNKMVYLPAIK